MKQILSLNIIIICLTLLYIPEVYAATCPLGKEVTTDLANILKIIQILGPIIVVVVTTIEAAKTISKGDAQKESKKLGIRLFKRIIYCLLLFFVPVLIQTGAEIAHIDVSSCDLSNPSDNDYTVVTTAHNTLTTAGNKTTNRTLSSSGDSTTDGSCNTSSSTKPKSASGTGYSQTFTACNHTFKLYKQTKFSSHSYCSTSKSCGGNYGNMGCGPTSVAIVMTGLGVNVKPTDVGSYCMKHSDRPSAAKNFAAFAKSKGLNATWHSLSSQTKAERKKAMIEALSNGHGLVVYVGKNGGSTKSNWYNFTHSGYHYISVLAYDSATDKVYVGNPSISGGWFKLDTLLGGMGTISGMNGWVDIYK